MEYGTILEFELAQLAESEDSETRQKAAQNPNTPPDVLAKLANDTDEWVRCAVACNENAPKDLLASLANNTPWVRAAVANNPSTPHDVLVKLSHDAYPQVQWNAEQSIRRIPSASATGYMI